MQTEEKQEEDLDTLITKFYSLKNAMRGGSSIRTDEYGKLREQKDRLLLRIKQELGKVSRHKAESIKKKLWDELGVLLP